ncbi:class F sortase [Micromonospora endophytica]|uniref:Class F sortase n=1 Tax=Micromonospora endophytica TaxID=515350 RepID=A0A2W2CQG6_9ACTN|nr:class F sortase [Micromonospora endophytica]PZG00813.1 class F sortase [Micromonospora endophytica]RIW42063.1 class F sortase [Micromonospora endophytica]BCJ59673.1 hypothetical protein Jiend_30950 [Micromonospora endophytica]
MTIGEPGARAGHYRGRTLLAVAATLALTAAVTINIGRLVADRPDASPSTTATAAPDSGTAPDGGMAPDGAARTDGQRGELTSGPLMSSAAPTRVSIPSLKVSAETVPLGLQADGTMQVPDSATDVGWYTRAPTPGALGPAVLAGHVDWKGHDGSFHDLVDLEPGAGITIDRADGSRAMFTVIKVERHPKDDFPSEAVYGPTDHAALRLITCGGEFDGARNSYRDNIIVYATLAHAHPA